MAAPTLNLTTAELRSEVARLMALSSTTYASLSAGEAAHVDSVIISGLRRFYAPQPLGPGQTPHQWSFLTPRSSVALVADTETYALPEDFGGMLGTFSWPVNTYRPQILLVSDVTYRELKSSSADTTGTPTHAVILPKNAAGNENPDIPTRFEVSFFPTPSESLTVGYRYYVVQNVVTGSIDPPGGGLHAETIIASCAAVIEERLDPGANRLKAVYAERLASSIAVDRRMGGSVHFGKNLDRSDSDSLSVGRTNVLYQGTQY